MVAYCFKLIKISLCILPIQDCNCLVQYNGQAAFNADTHSTELSESSNIVKFGIISGFLLYKADKFLVYHFLL